MNFFIPIREIMRISAFTRPSSGFLGLLLLIFLVGCAVAGFVMLRRQWQRTRLQDPRKDHYRRVR